MKTRVRQPDLLPADPIGQRLCEIFGHYRWKSITADLPDDVRAKPEWRTLKYEVRNRLLWRGWQDAATLVGVRFGCETAYGVIDIDAGSQYCNPESVARLRASLETIGVTRSILIRSSWNGGIHLYIPLPKAINTFNFAVGLKECLQAQGFRLKAGQLEIFPNPKPFGINIFTEYHAHRLPLQPGTGSCLLDEDFNLLGDSLARFFWLWDRTASHQDLDSLNHALKIGRDNHRKKPRCRRHPAESWRLDLEFCIAEGWTSYGQTNALLKTIACYGRVFEGLGGQDLADYVVQIAITRPGFSQYCRHQHELERKAQAWARAAENYYWPIGSTPSRSTEPVESNLVAFNRRQTEDAQSRITTAYAQLEEAGELPSQITARANAIALSAKVSQQTLYKHLSLWHPHHRAERQGVINDTARIVEPEMEPESRHTGLPEPLVSKALHPLKKNMKRVCEFGSDQNSFFSSRGVRGGKASFPQKEAHALHPIAPASLPRPQLNLELIPREPHIDSDLDEVIRGIQTQVRSLNWSFEKVSQFIADRFDGRRRYQLSDDELLLLLYSLRGIM